MTEVYSTARTCYSDATQYTPAETVSSARGGVRVAGRQQATGKRQGSPLIARPLITEWQEKRGFWKSGAGTTRKKSIYSPIFGKSIFKKSTFLNLFRPRLFFFV